MRNSEERPAASSSSQDKNRQKALIEERLDEELEESFPASDAPSITRPAPTHEQGDQKPSK